jgi:small neutral amino acid transporter SnatA (MarC family)
MSMSPEAHNRTLVVIHSLVGWFFALPLIAAPWVIAKNVDSYPSPRREGQIIIAVVAVCFVLLLALIFLSTAVGLYRRKLWGRKLAFVTSVLMLVWPPAAAYIWWFIHTEGGKHLYK